MQKKKKKPSTRYFGKVWAKHVDASSHFKICFSSRKTGYADQLEIRKT